MPVAAASTVQEIPAEIARRLLLRGAGLLDDPGKRCTAATVRRRIEALGFVQVDTISVVQRAHHHILLSRFHGYRPTMLTRLLERDRALFEHWTHDASVITTAWYPYWRVRFERYRKGGHGPDTWWARRMGPRPRRVIDHVLGRLRDEGPLMSRDFEHEAPTDGQTSAWWGWKPNKAALEYLWRTGAIAVRARRHFHKVYDLAARVFPDLHDAPVPTPAKHRDWACAAALDRLGVATTGELAQFMRAIGPDDARRWCALAAKRGHAEPVMVTGVDGHSRKAWAAPGWRERADAAPPPPPGLRVLSPFDPALRDRNRTERLFGFAYRFEAFVPAPKRQYGYYVMPLLRDDAIVGRMDAKLHRKRGALEVKGVWWEKTAATSPKRRRALASDLDEALPIFAKGIGAESIEHAGG